MAKFQFRRYSGVKTENTQSADKWLNFNLRGTLDSKLKILKMPRNE